MNSLTLLALLFAVYFLSYVSRKSLIFLTPHLPPEEFGRSQLGVAQSAFSLAYGIFKPLSNVIVTRMRPRVMLSLGVVATGLVVLFAGLLAKPGLLWLLWAVNGAICGMVWAPIAVLAISHFPAERRGRVWSLCSGSLNAGSTMVPVIVEAMTAVTSWDVTFIVIGGINLAVGAIVFLSIPDEKCSDSTSSSTTSSTSSTTAPPPPSNPWSWDIILNPLMIASSLIKLFTTFSVMAMSTWGQLYFLSLLSLDSSLSAGLLLSSYELGGLVGQTASGFVADLISNSRFNSRSNGRSITAMVFLTVGCGAAGAVQLIGDSYAICQVLVFAFGFGMYGCIAMDGLIVREFAPAEHAWAPLLVSIASSQVGGFVSGAPLAQYSGDWMGLVTMASPVALLLSVVMVRSDGRYRVKSE